MPTTAAAPATQDVHPAMPVAGTSDQHQYLTFMLGDEMFAIAILSIREIIEYGHLTDVPMTPPFIRGVINLRGAVVPVVDLALRLGREVRDITKRTCIVIVDIEAASGSQEMGVIVDTVSEVLEIPPQEVEPSPQFGASIRIDFISGMGKINGEFVVLLDLNRVMSIDEAAVAAAVDATAGN
jgi:purine-binding chemotaxis protein CheW